MMELREIETETKEQEDKSTDMALEVEDHKEKMQELEGAVKALKEAQQSVDSEGLQGALQEAESAKQAHEQRLEELREQKEELLQKNQEMSEQVRDSFDRKREALHKLPFLKQGMQAKNPEADVASSFYGQMEQALEEDMNRTARADQELQDVRQRLENLDI